LSSTRVYTARVRAIFFGTPAIAVPSLHALADVAEIVGVVSQPDRPSGRGLETHPTPIKAAALALGAEVHQPLKVRTGELSAWMRERRADVALVLAYGRILPRDVLDAPRAGCLNLHASLLPKLRGAAPINWAIVRGEAETGISLMRMDEGLDTGPVFSTEKLAIDARETGGTLAEKLANLAAEVVRRDLTRAVSGEIEPTPQDALLATHAPPITRDDCRVDWTKSAADVDRLVRGMAPRPGTFTSVRDKQLSLVEVRPFDEPVDGAPGTVRLVHKAVRVATGRGSVEIVRAKLEGKREQGGADLVNGRVLVDGLTLG
jgi:methionyl-tRNA formyltransferase